MLAELYNPPITVELHGTAYKVTRLTWGDFGELRAHARKLALDRLREDVETMGLDEEYIKQRKQEIHQSYRYLQEYLELPLQGDLIPMVAWLALRKHQPELTQETIREQWCDDDVLRIAIAARGGELADAAAEE